jgi:hypothetical protein
MFVSRRSTVTVMGLPLLSVTVVVKKIIAGQLRKLHIGCADVAFNTAAFKLFDTVRNVAGVFPVGLVDPLRSKAS